MTKITTMYFNKNNFTPINLKFYDMVNPVFSTFDNFQTMLPTDLIQFQEINFSPLIQRKIATKNQNSKDFFKEISKKIFFNDEDTCILENLLNKGYISFSTSIYNGILSNNDLSSAKAIKIDKNKSTASCLICLENYIKNEKGIGINFTEFNNPIEKIKDINSYFLYRQKKGDLNRPPAGIALLNINHPMIIDFITLKNDADFKDWCFDLSVIIPDDFFKKVDNDEYITLLNGSKLKAKKIYLTLLNSMFKKGEPGIIFSNDKDYICDCCATAPLRPDESLTLAHINLSKFYDKKNNTINFKKLNESANILSKALSSLDKNGYIGILGYQSLLNKMNIKYGSKEALKILDTMLKSIKKQTSLYNLKMAISPTGNVSRILKTSPSIEPDTYGNYIAELETLKTAQKYMEGNISKTIILDNNATINDIDMIVRKSKEYNLKGITVFKKQ